MESGTKCSEKRAKAAAWHYETPAFTMPALSMACPYAAFTLP
jgi:hypothetical protein